MLRRRDKQIAHVERLLAREDRVVSWAVTEDDVVVASRLGLWWPAEGGHRRIGWALIDKAVWDSGRLTVTEAEVVDGLFLVEQAPVWVTLTEPRDLPPTVRKRVESSVAQSELAPLPGGSGRFVARRVPGQDGLTWWCRLQPGTPDDPEVREAVADIIESLQAQSTPADIF
jgi:hypothetical protein